MTDEDFAEGWFENEYPGLLIAIKRAISKHVGDELYLREGVFDDLIFRLSIDIPDLTFKEALELAGRKPFDFWAVPIKPEDVK